MTAEHCCSAAVALTSNKFMVVYPDMVMLLLPTMEQFLRYAPVQESSVSLRIQYSQMVCLDDDADHLDKYVSQGMALCPSEWLLVPRTASAATDFVLAAAADAFGSNKKVVFFLDDNDRDLCVESSNSKRLLSVGHACWSRSNRRLHCYRMAGASVFIEGLHF